jgi:hypothetical protein
VCARAAGTSLTGNREPQPWYGFGGMVSV